MTSILNRFVYLFILASALCSTAVAQPTADQWRSDIDTLAENLLEHHPNFYSVHTVDEVEDAIETLDAALDTLDDQQVVMEISRIVAMGGDAHTWKRIRMHPAKLTARCPLGTPIVGF